MHAQSHQSAPRVLGRRTLERDHRYLAELLRPGLSVLDVGCATGAISSGIAKLAGPRGLVVGVERDWGLLEIARREHHAVPNLRFVRGDATTLPFEDRFDVVTAARTLQWISDPGLAILGMKAAAKRSAALVVLDYNHEANTWEPEPPGEFREFYRAFLNWRQANRWDNRMADHLPGLFQSAGLIGIESHVQDEVAERGEPSFGEQVTLWSEVIDKVGKQIAKAGFLKESQLRKARESYEAWTQTELLQQALALRAVVGRVP